MSLTYEAVGADYHSGFAIEFYYQIIGPPQAQFVGELKYDKKLSAYLLLCGS